VGIRFGPGARRHARQAGRPWRSCGSGASGVCRALAAAGAQPGQVCKITIYVVNHKREYLPIIEEARAALFGDHKPTDVLVGIATLSNPDYLIEVDAIAIID